MSQIRKATQYVFGQNALDWVDRSYVVDWYVAMNLHYKHLSTPCRQVCSGVLLGIILDCISCPSL